MTRAERFQVAQQRAAHARHAQQPGHASAGKRARARGRFKNSVPNPASHNEHARAAHYNTYEHEISATTRPSRKSSRKSPGRIKTDAEALRDRIEALVYEERRQASEEGKLFGSVTAQDIVDFLGRSQVVIERRRVHLDEPIKSLGESSVTVRVHPDVTAQLRVNVVRNSEGG